MPDSTPVYDFETADQYETLAWIKSSERKQEILTELLEAPKNTNDFANVWDVSPDAVRYHIQELEAGGPNGAHPPLVTVLTPQRRQYRLYGLTKTGEQIVEYL